MYVGEVWSAQQCKLRSVSAEWPFSFDPSAELDERHPASLAEEGRKGRRGAEPEEDLSFPPDKYGLMQHKLFPLLHR